MAIWDSKLSGLGDTTSTLFKHYVLWVTKDSDFTIRYEGNLQLIDKLRIAKEIALRLLDAFEEHLNNQG